MRQDLIKTILGVIVVGIVVVATFLYGNHQSQVQQQKDQAARQAQKQQISQQTKPTPPPQPAKPTPAASNPAPTSAKPTTKTAPATVATPSATNGSNAPLPQTGPGLISGILPILALLAVIRQYYRSRSHLRRALLTS